MAIAFDAAGGAGTGSWSHTCTGSNGLLLAFVSSFTDNTITATYNNVSMTSLGTVAFNGGGRYATLFYLLGPSTGANTLAISGDSGVVGGVSASYNGVLQSGFPDASLKEENITGVTSNAISVTTIADNCWYACGALTTTINDPTAGSGTTERGTTQDDAAEKTSWFDGNAAKTPAGSVTLNYSYGTSDATAAFMVSFAPSVAVSHQKNVLTMGVG